MDDKSERFCQGQETTKPDTANLEMNLRELPEIECHKENQTLNRHVRKYSAEKGRQTCSVEQVDAGNLALQREKTTLSPDR